MVGAIVVISLSLGRLCCYKCLVIGNRGQVIGEQESGDEVIPESLASKL